MSQPNPAPTPLASVVITSRNRKEDLLVAIESCLTQSVPLEVLVFDDASTDGTADAVREKFPPQKFPGVRFFRQEAPVGYIVLRNRGARLASTNYLFSIDDDAIFTTPNIVEQTLAEFAPPRIGAIAIPFQNIRISQEVLQKAPDNTDIYIISDYIGTAHAVRRDLFLQLGGYRESFIHQGEESDYCIRLLNAGYVVRMGRSDVVHHFVSPKRDYNRAHYYGSRNNILFNFFNVSLLGLPWYLFRTTLGTLIHGIKVKAFRIKVKAVAAGYFDGLRYLSTRRAVKPRIFRLFRQLRGTPMKLSRIVEQLPPPARPAAS